MTNNSLLSHRKEEPEEGILYLVGTPIGNLNDISKKQKEFLHINISNSKTNLAEIVESQFEIDFLRMNEIALPIVTDDAELIVTSFPENDQIEIFCSI